MISQFIDSFVVLLIAFYLGAGWDLSLVLAIGVVNYIYKFFIAILLTPLLYLLHFLIDRYLGKELSYKLIEEAAISSRIN
ncbi:MAG: VUT family protein [Ignavibacteriaceae bacterium]|nr:VUT family protein [Ignavibacteriaceae bacterium]